jgi:hypothetical protein
MRFEDLPAAVEARAQERADKAAMDELEALLDPGPDVPMLELAAAAIERSERAKSADPAILVRQLTDRVNGPADGDEIIRAEPEKGSYAWRVRELVRIGIRTYGAGGSH